MENFKELLKAIEQKIFSQMPLTLKVKVASARYYEQIQSAWVFSGVHTHMLQQVVIALRERYVMPLE
ncbi:hypothetical protein T492DRAFT_872648, partial [Pavlovales sp. CCMP2436]